MRGPDAADISSSPGPSSPDGERGVSAGPDGVQAIRRASRLLRILAEGDRRGMRLNRIAAASGLHKATVHRLLAALSESNLVEQDRASRLYRLGAEIFVLGSRVAQRFDLRAAAQSCCARICEATEDTVFLSIRRGFDSICIDRHEGDFPIKTLTLGIGSVRPLGVGAGSMALLAALPDAEVAEIIDGVRDRLAAYPQFTPETLLRLVEESRRQGYAFNDQRIIPGMSAIGVPVVGASGELLGALSVAAIPSRMEPDRREWMAGILRRESERLARRCSGEA